MDAKKTIQKLRGEADKSNVTLYLTESTFTDFKKAIHPIKPSAVIDELIKEFLEDLKRSPEKPTSKKKLSKKN